MLGELPPYSDLPADLATQGARGAWGAIAAPIRVGEGDGKKPVDRIWVEAYIDIETHLQKGP